MKRAACFAMMAVLAGALMMSTAAQDWSATLVVDPFPSPYLSDWQQDPTLAALEVVNSGPKRDVVIIDAEIIAPDGARYLAHSKRLLVEPNTSVRMQSTDLADWTVEGLSATARDQIRRTGLIPEGNGYQVCVTVRNQWDNVLVNGVCAFFSIAHPDPPQLVYPLDSVAVYTPFPLLQWIPPTVSVGKQVIYSVRVAEILPGQTPRVAIEGNVPQYENDAILMASIEYPPDALPLEEGARYAWQVQALDAAGRAVTSNNGRSEVGEFVYAGSPLGLPELHLSTPENNAVVVATPVVFEWNAPTSTVADEVYYTLRTAVIRTGQTPAEAIAHNVPHFVNNETMTATRFTYPESAPAFDEGQAYAWQVSARDRYGNPVAGNNGRSAVRAFTFAASAGVVAEDLVLPERIALPGEQIAYLELRANGRRYVDYTFSTDSTQLIISSPHDGAVPLVIPALQGDHGQPPRIGAAVDLRIDRYSKAIESGSVVATPTVTADSPFALERLGIPVALSRIEYRPSARLLVLSGNLMLFGEPLSSLPIGLTLAEDGALSQTVSSQATGERIPFVSGSDRLVYEVGRVDGTIEAALLGGANTTRLTFGGQVVFLPDEPEADTRRFGLDLVSDVTGVRVGWQENTDGAWVLELGVGSMGLGLHNLSCAALRYTPATRALEFDFVCNLSMTLSDFSPAIGLPAVPSVHLTNDGFVLPQFSLPNLPDVGFSGYRTVRVRPYACRMVGRTFDWFAWDGTDIGDWGLRFDLGVTFPGLPSHLGALATAIENNPLSVLNASYRNGRFHGTIEPRRLPVPLRVGLADSCAWQLAIGRLAGVFSDTLDRQHIALTLGADLLPPSVDSQATAVPLGDSAIVADPMGMLTASAGPFTLSAALPWGAFHIGVQEATLTLDSAEGAQRARMHIGGTVGIAAAEGPVNAPGTGVLDILANRWVEARFRTTDPVGMTVPPGSHPLIGVHSEGGATLNPDGLVLADGDGTVLVANGRVPASLSDDVSFGVPLVTLDSGRVTFGGTFALRVENLNGGAGLQWRAVGADATVATDRDNLLLRATATATIEHGQLRLNDTASADVRLNETDYANLQAIYHDVAVAVNEPRIVSGRISLSLDGTEVAYLDSSGFWPGAHFAVAAAEVIPLPDTAIAYVRTKRPDGTLVVRSEVAGEQVRLFTPEGTSAEMVVPALAYGGDAPRVPVTFDLVVNPVTLAPVGGTMTVTAADSGALFSLLPRGVALEVTRLAYAARDNGYGLAADVRAVLPRSLRGVTLSVRDVVVDTAGLTAFDNGFSTSRRAEPPRAEVELDGGMAVAFDGLRGNLAVGNDSLYVSGDVFAELFTDADAIEPTPLHFFGPLTARGLDAAIGEGNLNGGAVPVGQGRLAPIDVGDEARIALQAAMDDTSLSVVMAGALFSMPACGDNFALTLTGLRLSPAGLTIADSVFSGEQRQHTRLFGFGVRVDAVSVSVPATDELVLALDGRMGVFGGDVAMRELTLSTRDGVTGGQVNGGAMVLADSMLTIDSLAIDHGALRIRGALNAPRPFSSGGHNQLTLRIAPAGDWLDSSDTPLAVKHVAAVSEEVAGSDVQLGTKPMQITGRLAGLTLTMHGDNQQCRGEIASTVNTYWPGGDDDSATIVITGGVSFTDTQSTLDPWQVSGSSAALLSFAGLIDLNVSSVSVPDTNEFQLCVGGELTLGIEGITTSGGCQFSNFVLREDDFTFGRVQEGSMDLGLIALEITDFAYGKDLTDLRTYDIEFGSGMMQADSTTKSIPGFYVTFGGSIGSDLLGFEGGIDRLLVYKSPNNFHLLIDNAHFSYSDMVDGRLDLIADIPLQLDDFQFKFLIGGRLTVSGAGFAAVGELSYTETSLAGNTFKAPGFGIFLAAMGLDIKLLPLPITIEDVGGGIFFNPSPEVEEFVRGAVGLENSAENGEFFTALNNYKARFDGVMTFMEVYVYGAISVPDDKMLKGRSLLTMATDKYRIDAEFTVVGDSAMKKVCELGATGFLEIGVPQDFSSYPYAAGNLTLTAESTSPADSALDFIEFPTLASATATFEFFVAGAEAWALHGSMSTELFRVLESNFEIFLGPPGFLVRGSIERTFDAVVVTVDLGLEASIWYKWAEPSYWGGYGRAWVEAALLSEAFAGVRGELGIALIKELDVYFYGYAELTAWFLGIEWSKCVWVQWQDGEVSGGVGGDSRLIEIIEQSNELADEILGEVAEVQRVITQLQRDAFAQLTEAQIEAIVESLQNGQSAFYQQTLLTDADETILAIQRAEDNTSDQHWKVSYRVTREAFTAYRDALQAIFANRQTEELSNVLTAWNETVAGLDDALSQRLQSYDSLFAALEQEIARNAQLLDSVAVFSDADNLRLDDPLTVETITVADAPMTSLTFSIDEGVAERNNRRAQQAQHDFAAWLELVARRAARVDSLRTNLYAALGPQGRISSGQSSFGDPLFTADIIDSALLASTSALYRFYADKQQELEKKWFYADSGGTASLRNAFIVARWTDDTHKQNAFDRRLGALEQLAGSEIPVDLSVYNKAIAVDLLGIGFYRTVPQAYLSFIRYQLDSLYTHLANAHMVGIDARNETHRTFTSRTDALWNRYAEVSENLYQMYDRYLDELRLQKRLGVEELPMSVEDVRARADALAAEFTTTGVGSFSATVDDAEGRYLPTTVRLEYGGGPTLVEYAYAVTEPEEIASATQFQSVGNRERIALQFHPLPAVDQPNSRNLTIRTRVRNKAGYAVEGHSASVTIRNRDPLNDKPLTQISTEGPQSLAGITAVTFPDYPSADLGRANGGVVYYSNDPTRVRVSWDIETFFGGTSPFADMQCAVFRADRPNRVIGGWRSVGTMTTAEIDGLSLPANTGKAYIVKVRGKDANGAVHSIATSPRLYIDQSPPLIPRNATASFAMVQRTNSVVMTCPQAREYLATDDMADHGVNLSAMPSYQYKVWLDGADTTGLAWQPMTHRPYRHYTDSWYETSGILHLDIGTTPMRGSARVAIRARNTNPRCNNGYGPARVFSVPRQDDYTPAQAGRFETLGFDSTGTLLVRVIQAAVDSQSGVAGYQYQVVEHRSNDIIRPFPTSGASFDFAGDAVSTGDTLALALGKRPEQVRGAWLRIYLRGVNPTGQGSAAILTWCVAPATPQLSATLSKVVGLDGRQRFRVDCRIASGASHAQSYTVALRVGTRPGAGDLSRANLLFGPGYQDRLETGATLPDSISYGRAVYVSVAGVSRVLNNVRVSSDTVTVELATPDLPVLDGVSQDEQGKLTLRVAHAAFGGRESATYRYEIRNGSNDEVLRPFPAQDEAPDFTSDRVQPGARLTLSENASSMSPAIVVLLRADGGSGAMQVDSVRYQPVPAKPRLTAHVDQQVDGQYVLKIQAAFDTRLMQEGGQSGSSPHLRYEVCTGQDARDTVAHGYVYRGENYGRQNYGVNHLPDSVAAYGKLFLHVEAVSAYSVKSDTALVAVDLPRPPMFDRVSGTRDGNLTVRIISNGFPRGVSAAGYQYAVHVNDDAATPVRPWPASATQYDFTPQQVTPGHTLELPVDMSAMPLRQMVVVSLRGVSEDGDTTQQGKGYLSLPPVPIAAEIVNAEQPGQFALQVKGTFEQLIRFGSQLNVALSLGASPGAADVLSTSLVMRLDEEGYNGYWVLPSTVAIGRNYFLSAGYTVNGEPSADFRDTLTAECAPMFSTVQQHGEREIAVEIVREGFNGARNVAGYQWALGSAPGRYEIRPFPAQGSFDFAAGEVREGAPLIIEHPMVGLPKNVYVSLKAINEQGVADITTGSCELNAPMPVIAGIEWRQGGADERNDYLRWELDHSSVDAKCHMFSMKVRHANHTSVAASGRYFDSWEWSYVHREGMVNPVYECPVAKGFFVGKDVYVELVAMDRYWESASPVFHLTFQFDRDGNLNVVDTTPKEVP